MTGETSAQLPQHGASQARAPVDARRPALGPQRPGAFISSMLRLQRTVGNQAVQRLVGSGHIQRLQVYWRDPLLRRARDKDDSKWLVETSNLPEARRKDLVEALQARVAKDADMGALLTEIQAEWARAEKTAPPALGDLFAIGDALSRLESTTGKLNGQDSAELAGIIGSLDGAVHALVNVKKAEDAQLLRDTIQGLHIRANSLWTKRPHADDVKLSQPATEGAVPVHASDFTAEEVEAYRNDIREQGTWGGLAEAETAASAMQRTFEIFILADDSTYRRIITVGTGVAAAGVLLHTGDHYRVVQAASAVIGQPFAPAHVIAATRPLGDCLFEALIIAKFGAGAAANTVQLDKGIKTLRNATAAQLSEEQIRTSLLQILVHGESRGLGPGTQQIVRSRNLPPEVLNERLKDTKLSTDQVELVKQYGAAWKDNPASAYTGQLYDQMQLILKPTKVAGPPFVSLDEDVKAGRYAIKVEASKKIRQLSGEGPFPKVAGITVQQALEDAIAIIALNGSSAAAYSRHDFQDAKAGTVNLQIQLGGSKLNYRVGKGDSSITVVITTEAFWKEMVQADPVRWLLVIQAAHRRSFNDTSRVEFLPAKKT